MLTVGIPKEIKALEKRVGLTPAGVKKLHAAGIPVAVESGAGFASGFKDADYVEAGARILPDKKAVYQTAGIIQKVKEPLPEEYPLFKDGQIIFGFLHLAAPENCGLLDALLRKNITAIAYETIEKDGRLPLLAPMSEIAGGLAACYAAYLCADVLDQRQFLSVGHGLERIAAGYPKIPAVSKKMEAIIFGAGIAGLKAAEVLKSLGSSVLLVEKNEIKRSELVKAGWRAVSPEELGPEPLETARILIGSVHAKGQRAAKVITEERLRQVSARRTKVLIDISIDQGGNFPGSKTTEYADPVYKDGSGNLYFCVPNIPSFAGRQASEQLSQISLPYTSALAADPAAAFRAFPELQAAINVQNGRIVMPAIAQAHQR